MRLGTCALSSCVIMYPCHHVSSCHHVPLHHFIWETHRNGVVACHMEMVLSQKWFCWDFLGVERALWGLEPDSRVRARMGEEWRSRHVLDVARCHGLCLGDDAGRVAWGQGDRRRMVARECGSLWAASHHDGGRDGDHDERWHGEFQVCRVIILPATFRHVEGPLPATV